MKIDDILTDKVVDFSDAVAGPEFFEVEIVFVTVVAKTGHVPNRRIHPDIEVFIRTGDKKPKIGSVATYIPSF